MLEVLMKLPSKRMFALLTVVMMLSTPLATMAVGSTGRATVIEITVSKVNIGTPRVYADKSNWSMYLHDPAHTGYTVSPLPVNNGTIWTVDLGGLTVTAPVVANNTVVVATDAGVAHALNASTGIDLCSFNLGSQIPSTPAIWNGHVLIGMLNGDLISLVLSNCTKEWKVNLGGAANTEPVAANGAVYVGTGAGDLWAYNITDGKLLWNKATAGPVKYSPALSDKTLLVASGNTLQAFNASNGNPGWTCSTAGTEISGPSITGGPAKPSTWTAFVTSNDGKLYAINMTNGYTRWKGVITYGRPLTPTIKVPLVLVSGLDRVQALNCSTGKNVWNITATDIPVTPPVIGNSTLMFGTKVGLNVTAFTATTQGPQKWAYTLKSPNAPALAYGRAFVTTVDGKVVAFGHRPLAAIDLISPDPVAQNAIMTLKGHGQGASAYKTFRWSSSVDGIFAELPAQPTMTVTPTLSIGKHTISFQVQDDNWTWSLPVSGQVTVTIPKDWPMFRANTQRTGITDAKVPTTNSMKWTADLNDAEAVMSSPIIVGKFVFIGTRDYNMHSLNTTTGEELWSYTTDGSIESTAAYSNGYIYFGSDDSKVYCMESDPLADGNDEGLRDPNGAPYDLIWTFTTNGPIWSSPTVVNDVVYVVSEGPADQQHPNPGRLYALRTDPYIANREIWNFTIPNNVISYSSPLVYGNLVLFGTHDNNLYAVNRWSGKEVWHVTTIGNIWSSPTAANGLIYFGSNDGKVYAVWASNGTVAWSKPTGDEVRSSPAVSNGVVYIGSMDNKLYALNATTGAQKWAYASGASIWSSPAIAGDQVVFGDFSGNLSVVNTTTHALTWIRNVGDVFQSSPAVTDDTILIGSGNGLVSAIGRAPDLSVETGNISYSLSRPPVGVPVNVTVTIKNKGTMAGNGTFDIYDPQENKHIGGGFIQLGPGSNTKVSGILTPSKTGLHVIMVNITNIKPYDSNPANNRALGAITVIPQTEGWRMFQKDAQHSALSNVIAPNNPKMLWSATLSSAIIASPVFADQLVYVGTTNGIYAFVENPGIPTGYVKWSNMTIKNISATPAVVNGVVYAASADGTLYALDAWSGNTLWSLYIAAGPSSPVIYNNTLFIGTPNGRLMAIGAMNGTVLWKKTMGGQILGSPAIYDNKVVIVGNANGSSSRITSYDLLTGNERWSYKTGFNMLSSPSVEASGFVYIADTNGTIYKFDAAPSTASPKLIWHYSTGLPIQSTITISNNNIYLTAGNTTIMSLTTSGELNWRRAYAKDENLGLVSSPAIAQNRIYVGGNNVYCLERTTGQTIWSYNAKSQVDASPAVIDDGTAQGKVIFASNNGGVYAFGNITLVKPKAIISAPKNNETYRSGENITFDGSPSIDDGVITEYRWDLGDGNNVLGMTVTHAYDRIGNFTIELTVKDNELPALTDISNVTIHVVIDHSPSLSGVSLTPLEGDTTTKFNFTATYKDPEGDPPAYIKVVLAGLDYQMEKVDKAENDYRAGVRYYCSTKLPSGNHTYQVRTSDGILSPVSPTHYGPKVWQVAKFTKAEISVEMRFVGDKGTVQIEGPTFPPVPPKGLNRVDILVISTQGISEWSWMRLVINGTGRNITDNVVPSSLNFYWFNGTWHNLTTTRDLAKQLFTVYVTSDQTPLLGTFGLFGAPLPAYVKPYELTVKTSPADVINVKGKVTLNISAKDDQPVALYFNVKWGETVNGVNETGWKKGTASAGSKGPYLSWAPVASHLFNKKGTFRVEVYVTDDQAAATNPAAINQSRVTKTTLDITVREEGSSEALVLLVVIILVVLAVAFAVPIKGDKEDEEEEEEEEEVDKEEEEEADKGGKKGKKAVGKGKGKGKAVAAEEE